MTTIRLDKFVYDPSGGKGVVELVADSGAFRFITGLQPHENYLIKTPYATMGVRGTEFIVVMTPDGVQIQLNSGELVVTTISGKVVTLSSPNTMLSVDSQGNTQGPTPMSQPLVNFADLGPPLTNLSFADALDAFSAVTGNMGLGATSPGGGEGGGGGGVGGATVTAFGGGGGGATPNLGTFVVTTPGNSFTLNLSGPSGALGTSSNQSVSPH